MLQICEVLTAALFSPESRLSEEQLEGFRHLLAVATAADDRR